MLFAQLGPAAPLHRPDTAPLQDPDRVVSSIGRTGFELHYATASACETKVEVRAGDGFAMSAAAAAAKARVVSGNASASLWHTVSVTGLQPGKRYYYRVYDPSVTPSATETAFGAETPWSREYAVSTLAPAGKKTIIHLPIKVLLMPNVVNAETAVQPDGSLAPEPSKATLDQIALIESEFRLASRDFWVNSGMRLWVDFKFFVDDRWQRWGAPAPSASAFFQNLPECRNYAGSEFVAPGGGMPTWFDTHDLTKLNSTPVKDGFAGQIEMAWPRRWDPAIKQWILYPSREATGGAADLVQGGPMRSQFLAGGDTAWLAASAIQSQLEAMGEQSLENTEDDRLVGDTPVARHRFRRGDGTYDEQPWNSAGPHGEAWDYLRYWDSAVSDSQWLRLGYGTTETVGDKKGTGFPDNDPRLPLDAARFAKFTGSTSFEAACNYDWTVLPIQPSWLKDRSKLATAMKGDSIVNLHVTGQPNEAEWAPVPVCGSLTSEDLAVTFKEAYDASAYYGLVTVKGPFNHVDVDVDGDEKGLYGSQSAFGFSVTNLKPAAGEAGPMGFPVSVKPTLGLQGNRIPPWLIWNAARKPDGSVVFVFKVPNGGDSPWFWRGAGHKVGVAINAYDQAGHGWSMGEPYRLDYAEMVKRRGRSARPPAPVALDTAPIELKPGDKAFALSQGWTLEDGSYVHSGAASAIVLPNQKAVDFDLNATVEGPGEVGLGAFAAQTPRPEVDRDYTAMVSDSSTEISVYGDTTDPEPVRLGNGTHKLELRRREGGLWLLVDGQVRAYAPDSNPKVVLNRFALLAGPGSLARVSAVSYREATEAPAVR